MNESELSTAVRASVADLHAATPVTQIIRRGRAVRARRRAPVAAGALAVAAGTAVAVTALLPAGQPGSPAGVRLAAWTVARQADGDIVVTVNQLRNPAGLQAALRADGLPVRVSFVFDGWGRSCRLAPMRPDSLRGVVLSDHRRLAFDPSALPRGTGVVIVDHGGTRPARPAGDATIGIALVYASPQCTG
jgi:hypothetical protein